MAASPTEGARRQRSDRSLEVYALDWLVMTNGVMCGRCQARSGPVSAEDAQVDDDDVLNGD